MRKMAATESTCLLDDSSSQSSDTCLIPDLNEVYNRKTRSVQKVFSHGDFLDVPYQFFAGKNHDGSGANKRRSSSSSYVCQTCLSSDSCKDVVCVFVVVFDTRAGNIVEWSYPADVDLEGIEFKAMPSGSHRVTYDFIYFKQRSLYGLSCFENMPVDNNLERGARMKSVGVLTSSYKHLHEYKMFLESQVRHLLKCPGSYDHLREFCDLKKGLVSFSQELHSGYGDRFMRMIRNDFKISHPAGCFAQFIRFFGPHVFLLWKYALLQKRILFFSPPPIGVVCFRVYCTNCLANHKVSNIASFTTNVLFYVNVADIDMLEDESSYIACTTEKIFEAKSHLYDIYVDNQNITVQEARLKKLVCLTDADKGNYDRLCSIRQDLVYSSIEDSGAETDCLLFFTDLNNRIFSTLFDASCSNEKQLSVDDVRYMGLDPKRDLPFLQELVELYDIEVVLPSMSLCCPT